MAKFRTMLALGVSFAALAAPVHAQADPAVTASPSDDEKPATETAADAPADPAAKDDDDAIVITADRREQSLQDYAGTAATFLGR